MTWFDRVGKLSALDTYRNSIVFLRIYSKGDNHWRIQGGGGVWGVGWGGGGGGGGEGGGVGLGGCFNPFIRRQSYGTNNIQVASKSVYVPP